MAMGVYNIRTKLNLLLALMLWDLSMVESVVITNQSQLNQFLNSSRASSIKGNGQDINISLDSDSKSYVLDIVTLMRMNISDRNLIMKGEGGLAKINCTTDHDLEKLQEIVQPILHASLVLIDGLEFTSCPVPIMIEKATKVMIQNCVFQNHKHGALSIYNSKIIKVKNCTFRNNTSDSYFTKKPFQGSAGGLSIGYNSSNSYFYLPDQDNHNHPIAIYRINIYNFTTSPLQYPHVILLLYTEISIEIINCTLTDNSAVLPAGQGGSSTDVLINNVFVGRGGALSVLINTDDYLKFKLSNNSFINNSAESFGGGVYCLTQRGYNQTYTIYNNVFMNNKGPRAGALGLFYLIDLIVPNNSSFNYDICNCTFYNNNASLIAGAVVVSAVYKLTKNVNITFKGCIFSKNEAVIHGGAVDTISFDFFNSIPAESQITFINCIFDDNVAADGAAINLLHYGAKFYNVTFRNNRESAVQMIGCIVEFHDEVKFIGNKAKDGGALYINSFGQLKVFPGTVLIFEKNEGKIGASIVVLTKKFSHAPAFNHLIYNPQCFLLHQDSKIPYSSVDNVKMRFTNNNASEATAIFIHNAQQCSWIGYSPPYFDTASILHWKFLNISDQLNVSQNVSSIEASLSDIEVLSNNLGDKYPGENFPLYMRMIDEMNQTASGFMQLDVVNIDNQLTTEYKIHPAIVYHQPSKLQNITVVTTSKAPSTMINGTNVTVVVREFMTANKSISSNFTLRVVSCMAGYELKYDSMHDGFICQRYRGNTHIGTCEEDHTILLLADGQWGLDQRYIEQPENLTVYSCPPGYCRCFQNLCGSDDDICSFAYFNGASDKQCHCDRKGYLCGDCKDGKGVSALLNRCVDCGHINILILAALFIADATLIIVMLCKDFDFSALLFPTVFFINMVSYTGESYPTSYDRVGKYMYFINSLLSLYFPYDFCLYSGATPLATYAFRYFPICLTIIICFIGFILHQCICKRVKRFSWNNLWLLLTLQYSNVVYTSVSILHCPQVLNENGEYESRWFVKGSLQCFTNYHILLALCAIIILVICLLLIPFLGLVATGKLTRPHLVGKLTKHLQHPFKENLPWWCMIELGRKLVFLQLLIPFPQNTGPPMFILMTTFALYAFMLPYKEMFVNITELLFQLSLLIFLTLRSTKSIVDGYLKFPYHKHSNIMDTTRCSSDTGIASLTWILFPFAYLPLVVIIVIFIVKMSLRLWQCVCCKLTKKHHKHVLQGKSTTSCLVNPSSTNYYLVD